MRLYICWGTFRKAPRAGEHPCGRAYAALVEAGHEPELVKSYGAAALPFLNRTRGRREVRELTGRDTVPVLVTDDGEVITESRVIAEWARDHPTDSHRAH